MHTLTMNMDSDSRVINQVTSSLKSKDQSNLVISQRSSKYKSQRNFKQDILYCTYWYIYPQTCVFTYSRRSVKSTMPIKATLPGYAYYVVYNFSTYILYSMCSYYFFQLAVASRLVRRTAYFTIACLVLSSSSILLLNARSSGTAEISAIESCMEWIRCEKRALCIWRLFNCTRMYCTRT